MAKKTKDQLEFEVVHLQHQIEVLEYDLGYYVREYNDLSKQKEKLLKYLKDEDKIDVLNFIKNLEEE